MDLSSFRKYLHSHPELSGNEAETSDYIKNTLSAISDLEIVNAETGHGFFAFLDTGREGSYTCFRADIDALPIDEKGKAEHKSLHPGVSHKCGHDGHATILTGLIFRIFQNLEHYNGKFGFIFQSEEETGCGAEKICKLFANKKPDLIFGLHNIPGIPAGSISIRTGTFASASAGVRIKLQGAASHASQPYKGRSPVLALIALTQSLLAAPQLVIPFENNTMVTIVHVSMGQKAFGTSPADAEVMATLRAYDDESLGTLLRHAEAITKSIAAAYGVKYEFSIEDYFPATVNEKGSTELVGKAAENLHLNILNADAPFPWSEDFAHYLRIIPGAFFGLGAGEATPPLHDSDYDFPDFIIEDGINIFEKIAYLTNSNGKP